jgi:hypothetical protein
MAAMDNHYDYLAMLVRSRYTLDLLHCRQQIIEALTLFLTNMPTCLFSSVECTICLGDSELENVLFNRHV